MFKKLKMLSPSVLAVWLISSCSVLISTRSVTMGNAQDHSSTSDAMKNDINGGGLTSSADPTTNAALNQKESDTIAEMLR